MPNLLPIRQGGLGEAGAMLYFASLRSTTLKPSNLPLLFAPPSAAAPSVGNFCWRVSLTFIPPTAITACGEQPVEPHSLAGTMRAHLPG